MGPCHGPALDSERFCSIGPALWALIWCKCVDTDSRSGARLRAQGMEGRDEDAIIRGLPKVAEERHRA